MWGRELVRRARLPPGKYMIPAGVGNSLFRGLFVPWVLTIVIALVPAALSKR